MPEKFPIGSDIPDIYSRPPFITNRLRILTMNLIPENQLVSTVSGLVEGKIISWNKPEALSLLIRQSINPLSNVNKIINTLTSTHGQAVENAHGILFDDLRRFHPEKRFLQSPQLQEWFCKLMFGLEYIDASDTVSITQSNSVSKHHISARQYYMEVKEQAETAIETIDGLDLNDLPNFFRWLDLYNYGSDEMSRAKTTYSKGDKRETFFNLTQQIHDKTYQAWARLGENWAQLQIQQTVSMLPSFYSTTTTRYVIATLESNLIDHPPKASSLQDRLDIQGVIDLLKFRWQAWDNQKHDLNEDYPTLAQSLETPFDPPTFLVPRKYLPSTAIELLTYVEPLFLVDIQQEVNRQPEVQTPWLLTLLALRARKPFLGTFIDQALANLDKLAPNIRQILLNEQPGTLWLDSDGKIHTTKKGVPIFTSKAEALPANQQEELPPVKLEPQPTQPEPELTYEQITLPFFGNVDLLKGEVREFMGLIFQKAGLKLDLDNLYNQYEPLSQVWGRSTHDRNFLYICRLNSFDQYIKDTQKLGIEAIYIKANNFYFILGERENLKAFVGSLDRQGQLHIQDTDSFFLGEPEQLFLNNLALHLTTQPLHEKGMVASYKKEVKSAINSLVASWNGVMRGRLPKVVCSAINPYIVAQVEGVKEPILLAAISK